MDKGTIIEGETVPVNQMNLNTVLGIPAVRQVSILLGVAAAVAAGVAVVLWSQAPGFTTLYAQLDGAEAAEVVDALRSADIEFKYNTDSGSVLVPEASLHSARLELASQGLPQSSGGIQSLKDQPTFGQSQFRESALYQHALESELATTISYIAAVRDARVHLALPRQSAFVRDRRQASASVMLNLYRGRELEDDQAASIVNLVASSVPNLRPSDVTVIDQRGQLLSSGGNDWDDRATTSQFKIAERVERNYKRRIEDLLSPLVGPGRVRAEVVADLDFTVSEQTREFFDPANSAVISESISQNATTGSEVDAGGVPGALSNQPPEAGGIDAADAALQAQQRTSSTSTRNFEVDRTISHTRPQLGSIRRLSVAVLIDDRPAGEAASGNAAAAGADGDAADGAANDATLSPEAIERYTALIKEAVGFDEARGDTVAVIGAAFQPLPDAPEIEPPGLLDNPTVTDALKQILGAVLVLALGFGLVRPMLKALVGGSAPAVRATPGDAQAGAPLAMPTFDEKIAAAKNISAHDPAKVAQVVRRWVESDAA